MLTEPLDRVFVDRALTAGVDTLVVDVSNVAMGEPGSDADMTYGCKVDRIVDGALSTDAIDCTATNIGQMPLGAGSRTFDTATGALAWSPDVTVYGAFEFTISGTNAGGQDVVTFVVDVRPPYLRGGGSLELFSDYDVQFATQSGFPTSSQAILADLLGGPDASLGGTAPDGFAGTGTRADPHRLELDGAGVVTLLEVPPSSALMFDGWVMPGINDGAVLWQTGGLALWQISQDRLVLSTGVALPPAGQTNWPDASGYRRDITLSNFSGTWWAGTGVPADPYRLQFDGVDDRGAEAGTTTTTPAAVTLEAWLMFSQQQQAPGDYDYPVAMGDYGGYNRVAIARTAGNDANPNRFYYAEYGGRKYGPVLPGQQWIHVAASFTRSPPAVRVHLDGVLRTVQQPSGQLLVNGDALGLGVPLDGTTHHFNGSLAVVRQWMAVLDDAQVRHLYNRDAERFGKVLSSGPEAPPPTAALRAAYDAATPQLCTTGRLPTSAWSHVGVVHGANNTVVVNGQPECQSTTGTSGAAGTTLMIAPAGEAATWTGAIADFRGYSSGTALNVKTNFDATANRFRTFPLPWVDMSQTPLLLDAANADDGVRAYSSRCGTLEWFDLGIGRRNATVTLPPICAGTGWVDASAPAFNFTTASEVAVVRHEAGQIPAAFSVEAWVKASAPPDGDPIVIKSDASMNDGYGFVLPSSFGSVSGYPVRFFVGASSTQYAEGQIALTAWTHLMGTFANGLIDIYVDGALIDGGRSGARVDNSRDIYIGESPGGTAHFEGQVAFVAVHSAALDAPAVLARCEALAPRFGVTCTP